MASKARGSSDPNRKRLAAERAAEARRRIAEEQRRRRRFTVLGAVGAIVVVIAVLIVVKVVSGSSNDPTSGKPATAAGTAVTSALSGVPASVFDTVGRGDAKAAPQPATGAPLTAGGKPRVLYVGAEWCPYCAAERWAIAVALERFGDFTGLQQVSSAPKDVYPNTPSLSFHGAAYTSNYLAFTGKELQTNQVSGSSYTTLDTLTGADEGLFEKAGGGFPFVDLGGSSSIKGAQYDPSLLKGKTQTQIATALSNPKSKIALSIVGSANLVTASLCRLTGNAPAAVCTSSGVRTAAAALPSG